LTLDVFFFFLLKHIKIAYNNCTKSHLHVFVLHYLPSSVMKQIFVFIKH